MAFQRIAENAETEQLGIGKWRTAIYPRAMWLNDGGQWVGKKRNDLTDMDHRIELPGGHWIESKRSLARFLIGKNLETRFNMDVKMETVGGGNNNYSLNPEARVITRETVDEIDIEWPYSHKQGPTTYPSVFKVFLKNNDFQFQFTAPEADTYRLFLQVTPVIGGVVSSRLRPNKQGRIIGAEWTLDDGQQLFFNLPSMVDHLDEIETVLLGDTLFLYSLPFTLNPDEGFTLG